MIRAGLLNKVLTFKSPIGNITNDYGEEINIYDEGVNIRARVVFNAVNREVVNDEIVYPNTIKITIRNHYKINSDMIIIYNDKEYRILSIDDTITGEININAELIND